MYKNAIRRCAAAVRLALPADAARYRLWLPSRRSEQRPGRKRLAAFYPDIVPARRRAPASVDAISGRLRERVVERRGEAGHAEVNLQPSRRLPRVLKCPERPPLQLERVDEEGVIPAGERAAFRSVALP